MDLQLNICACCLSAGNKLGNLSECSDIYILLSFHNDLESQQSSTFLGNFYSDTRITLPKNDLVAFSFPFIIVLTFCVLIVGLLDAGPLRHWQFQTG